MIDQEEIINRFAAEKIDGTLNYREIRSALKQLGYDKEKEDYTITLIEDEVLNQTAYTKIKKPLQFDLFINMEVICLF